MKAGGLRIAAATAVLALFIPAVSQAGGFQEKLGYCKDCHGNRFQGFQGYYLAPRLAGQPAQYLENQFKAFRGHVRNNPNSKRFMWVVVGGLSPRLQPEIAKYLSQYDAPPAGDGPRHLVDEGKKLFEEGTPDGNVPACAACHQPDAHGNDQVPRLAGQRYDYVVRQLTEWNSGYRQKSPDSPGDDNTMLPIAKGLTKDQIRAVAAYVSYQR